MDAVYSGEKVHLAAQVPVEMRTALLELALKNERTLSAELRRAIVGHLLAENEEDK